MDKLKSGVHDVYSNVASNPKGVSLFPVGRGFAEEIGYGSVLLDTIPVQSVESFAGVSNVSVYADISPGQTVLDIGCGAGLDALVAADRVGASGKVIGVDFSSDMIDKARGAAALARIANASFHCSDVEGLPLDDDSVDVILANGIFNLNPVRSGIFSEMYRVLRNGGRVFASELIVREPDMTGVSCTLKNWFS